MTNWTCSKLKTFSCQKTPLKLKDDISENGRVRKYKVLLLHKSNNKNKN